MFDRLKNMLSKKARAWSEFFVLLAISVALIVEFMPPKPHDFSVIAFDSVVAIPDTYFIDSKIRGSEIMLIGENGAKIIIGEDITQELLSYSRTHMNAERQECGIRILFGTDPVSWALLVGQGNYLYLVGDQNAELLAIRILTDICNNKIKKIQSHKGLA